MYLALAVAVLLTLVSSAVGVFYFERSGDLNYEVESQAVPALEASWNAAREAERLRSLGLEQMLAPDTVAKSVLSVSVDDSLARLEAALTEAGTVPVLESTAVVVQDAAYDAVEAIDSLEVNRTALLEANESAADVRARMEQIPADSESSVRGLRLLGHALRVESQGELDVMWEEFVALSAAGIKAETATLLEAKAYSLSAASSWH